MGAAIAIEAVLISAWVGPSGLFAQVNLSVLAISVGAWTAYSSSALGSLLGVAVILAPTIAPTCVEAGMEVLVTRPLESLGVGGLGQPFVGSTASGAFAFVCNAAVFS